MEWRQSQGHEKKRGKVVFDLLKIFLPPGNNIFLPFDIQFCLLLIGKKNKHLSFILLHFLCISGTDASAYNTKPIYIDRNYKKFTFNE